MSGIETTVHPIPGATWQSAKTDVSRMTAAILQQIAAIQEQYGEISSPVRLAIYPSAHDFRSLRPADPWSWEHHTEVVRAVQRLLKRHGIKAQFVACTAAGCLSWLDENGKVNSSENRAAYVSLKSYNLKLSRPTQNSGAAPRRRRRSQSGDPAHPLLRLPRPFVQPVGPCI